MRNKEVEVRYTAMGAKTAKGTPDANPEPSFLSYTLSNTTFGVKNAE